MCADCLPVHLQKQEAVQALTHEATPRAGVAYYDRVLIGTTVFTTVLILHRRKEFTDDEIAASL